ncbi:MAG: ABC transporter permease subunit [Cyclobacteriaceae bacterium]
MKKLVPLTVIICLWQLLSFSKNISQIPSFIDIGDGTLQVLAEVETYIDFGETIIRTLVSFFASALLGIGIGVLISISKNWKPELLNVVHFFRSIPAPALLPFFMSIFGLYYGPKLAFAIFVCSLVNVIYVYYAIEGVKSLRLVHFYQILNVRKFTLYIRVILPASWSGILSGLKVSLSLSLVLTVLAEYVLLTGNGIGGSIRMNYEDQEYNQMYALIILLGLLGYILNRWLDNLDGSNRI